MAFLGVAHVTEWAKIRLSFIILQKIPVFALFSWSFFPKGRCAKREARGGGCPGGLSPSGIGTPRGQNPAPLRVIAPTTHRTPQQRRSRAEAECLKAWVERRNQTGPNARAGARSYEKHSFCSPNRWLLIKKKKKRKEQRTVALPTFVRRIPLCSCQALGWP